ncbi:hypothetical protein [Allomuricauda sp. SCSIO 64092]|nr:hypothetical protein [Muricauda sp. SCSIO 64092]
MNIPESKGLQGIEPFTGSFKHYLKGTEDAIKVKQRFKNRAKI